MQNKSRHLTAALSIILTALLGGCATLGPQEKVPHQVSLEMVDQLLPESRLLDVWIQVFEPGPLPDKDDEENQGITEEIRQAESRFIPVHLKNTLQSSGYWGAVRVVPDAATGGELQISGKILESDGQILALQVEAKDSRGEIWLNKAYRGTALISDYEAGERLGQETFQNLYNAIANDLVRHQQGLTQRAVNSIRQVAELRFAADLLPEFTDYLDTTEQGFALKRLPSEQDPMFQRIRTIRERDYLLIDTINSHYDNLYRDLQEPYHNWRKFRFEEAENLRQVKKDAMLRKALGIGAIIGAIAIEVAGGNSARVSTSSLRNAMIIGGIWATKSGFDKDSEKQIHIDAMQELGASFESEASPLVIEVEGETHRLTGSAEQQYAKWRSLLHRIHATEIGLPDNVGPPAVEDN